MNLRHGDLRDCVLKKISIDQYEPKTGNSEDTIVVAFQTPEQAAGIDLHSFFNSGKKYIKDTDVSPNKNDDGFYMVFLEIDRDEKSVERILEIMQDAENLTGHLNWEGTTHIHDDPFPIDENLSQYIMSSPDEYQTRDQWEDSQMLVANESAVLEFLKDSSLQDVNISENTVTMKYYDTNAILELVAIGKASDVMQNVGIAESALKPLDSTMKNFNKMLGEMNAVKIDEYIVIFHPVQNTVMVTKECSV
jgi:hypothetical protein